MSFWNANSDLDYYDELGGFSHAVRFECAGCGEDVWIGRSEQYPGPKVWCERCIQREDEPVCCVLGCSQPVTSHAAYCDACWDDLEDR